MRRPPLWILPLIVVCLIVALGVSFRAQTAGGNKGTPGRPPTGGADVGLPGSKRPTSRVGSHESSARDEADRVAGKFPAPKDNSKNETDEQRRNAAGRAGTAYVDLIAVDGAHERQALTLTRDDFQVTVDGLPRKMVSLHYVFRGPQAPDAGRSMAVGRGVLVHADEARTLAIVVDETSFGPSAEHSVRRDLRHLLELTGSVDRVAVLTLPTPGPLKFAGTHADLLASVNGVVARRAAAVDPAGGSLDALARLVRDLGRNEGPKSVIVFSAAPAHATRLASSAPEAESARVSAVVYAAAAARAVVHLVTPPEPAAGTSELNAIAHSTGGTVTRLTGEPHDLAPLAAALLGNYVLEVEARPSDRDGATHALAVTTAVKNVRLLVPSRWMPRGDPLPAPVVATQPAAKGTR